MKRWFSRLHRRKSTLLEYLREDAEVYRSMGWACPMADGDDHFWLYERFENGELHKTPTVGVSFYSNKHRPYYIFAPSLERAHTRAKRWDAASVLQDLAERHAPNSCA